MATIKVGIPYSATDYMDIVGGINQDGNYFPLELGSLMPDLMSSDEIHVPAANTAAVVTLAADPGGGAHVITGISYSYGSSGTLAGGRLTITDNAVTVFDIDIATKQENIVTFSPPKMGTPGSAVVVTLAAGGASVQGKLNLLGHWVRFSTPAMASFNSPQNSMYIPVLL